ncbi:MAG: response regulator [Chitinophagaceae bacterium]|nr:MAG: response regulator [Chitinophagaceae bacterium]
METRKLVLYADDDIDDLEMMEQLFADYPAYNLRCFLNAYDLIAFLVEHSRAISLIILDHNMPTLSGQEALQRIRLMYPDRDLPVVVYTTSVSPVLNADVSALRGVSIQKPGTFLEVKERLKTIVQYCEE